MPRAPQQWNTGEKLSPSREEVKDSKEHGVLLVSHPRRADIASGAREMCLINGRVDRYLEHFCRVAPWKLFFT